MTEHDDGADAFEDRLRKRLQREADTLGSDIERRLRLARHAALDGTEARASWRAWWPAGAAAAIALVAALVFLGPRDADLAPDNASPIMADLEVLADDDELDLLEDLEFYAWLGEQDDVI